MEEGERAGNIYGRVYGDAEKGGHGGFSG